MNVGVGKDESTVLCGDGVNGGGDGVNGGGEGESEVVEGDGVQGEQQVELRGDDEHLGCGYQGEKGEVQVERENNAALISGAEVAGETGEAEEAMELEASAPLKRRSKRKSAVTSLQASKQASKLAAESKELSDSSDAESWVSDISKVSVSQKHGMMDSALGTDERWTCVVHPMHGLGSRTQRLESHKEVMSHWISSVSPAALTVSPSRSQFFRGESVTLKCEDGNISDGWTVMRNRTGGTRTQCDKGGWGKPVGSTCSITLHPSDSGVYWCESTSGSSPSSSSSIQLSVSGGSVILQSPVLPVMEGDDVTLSCRAKSPAHNLPAAFYKDKVVIGHGASGNFTLKTVKRSDEGFYKCSISDQGESPSSWIWVKALRRRCFTTVLYATRTEEEEKL
ncbi:uncharacterized protein LOC103460740 [Poecilia reticulata]|uniref:uncharacterized protein LOC103460740 n=1 Tax=Poecilia reticulata TaxID=8081 RepID=UPI0007EACB2A|nr:PREDICTED: uncharacterized protein LOC103460740 [Poecilia reticulata]